MDIRQINDEYSVSGQITVEDLDQIKALGFKSIVCHRPDFEAPDQPTFDSIAARAEELGIETMHIPVGPMGVTADAVKAWSTRSTSSSARCSAIAAPVPARRPSTSRPSISAAEPKLSRSAVSFHLTVEDRHGRSASHSARAMGG